MTTVLLDNRYKILQTLGRGGFGQTFLAIDTHMPSGRQCVIKHLQPANPEPTMQKWVQERFQREAAILERLGEQNSQIPRLYAYFSEGESFYLVQEWISGVTLREKQQQEGSLLPEEVKEILIGILPVLAYVHSLHIVHRDIKPDNIILRASDGKPVLIDFGAVKEAMNTMVNLDSHSYLSVAIGTPGYMPSEQAAGRPVYSSDLYSLGLTAIFLLTGKNPQELKADSNTGEILWQEEVSRRIDPQLVGVIDRAIQFHPRDRFSSASEMLSALHSATEGSAVATVVVSPKGSPTNGSYATKTEGETQTKVAIADSQPKKNWSKSILPMILIGGIGLLSFAFSFNFLKSKEQAQKLDETNNSSEIVTIPDEAAEQPTNNPATTSESLKEEEIPNSTETEQVPSSEEDPSIFVDATLESSNPDSNSQPSQEDTSQSPPASSSPNSKPVPQEKPIQVPAFVPGTPKDRVVATLGKPTYDKKGHWGDSRAVAYVDFVPDRVHLGYVFDRNTGRLRQTEVTLAQSVGIEVMERTVNDLLGGNFTQSQKDALDRVYQRQDNLRSFGTGNLEVIIQRDSKDRIYIGIWEKGFHN